MTEDQEIVIVGKDGKEHIFPQGFDPKKAAQIVAQVPSDPSQPMTAQLPSMADMQSGVFQKSPDGDRFQLNVKASKPPRGMLPVLAGMASAFIPGGAALRMALGTVAGAGGDAAESVLNGERPNIGHMATEGAVQGAFSGAPSVAGPVGRAASKVGGKLAGFSAGNGTQALLGGSAWAAAEALPPGLREGAALAAMKMFKPTAEGAVKATGRGVSAAGNALESSASKMAVDRVVNPFREPGRSVVTSHKTPFLPDALRKMQLVYRALTGQQER